MEQGLQLNLTLLYYRVDGSPMRFCVVISRKLELWNARNTNAVPATNGFLPVSQFSKEYWLVEHSYLILRFQRNSSLSSKPLF